MSIDWDELETRALAVRARAHAPYSNYLVGAALVTKGGSVYAGCNVENASYGLAVCAERIAVFGAVADGARAFEKLAVVCACPGGCLPCGACRQVLAEFAPGLPLVLGEPDGAFRTATLDELLPQPFLPDHLDKP